MKEYDFPLIGDIILVTSQGKASLTNRLWQRLWNREKISFSDIPSHVAICKGGTIVLHALTNGGSQISTFANFFNQKEYKDNIRVFRSIELEKKIKEHIFTEKFLVEKIEKHWGEPYNFGVIRKRKKQDKKFCSEVVTIFLQDIGVLDNSLIPSRTYPIQLMCICQEISQWKEVTSAYKVLLSPSFIKEQFDADKKLTDNKEVHV